VNHASGNTTMSDSARRRRTGVAAALLVVAGLAAYANGLTGRFAGLDARESIRDNLNIRHLWPLSDAMSLPLLSATKAADTGSKGGTVVRRPVLSLSFALNFALTGMRANGFHAINILIHLCAAFTLFGIVRRTLARSRWPSCVTSAADGLACTIAALWLVHPVQTESVTYIVQRAESLMGLFFLLTLYAAIRAFDAEPSQARGWQILSVACAVLGMGTKEVAAVAPVIVLLYDATFVSDGVGAALRRRAGFYVALAATWLLLLGLMLITLEDVGSDFSEGRNVEDALAQPAVILHYLRIALWPYPLHVFINTTTYDHLSFAWIALPGIAVLAALAGTLAGLAGRRWYGFAGAWFFLILAPSSSIVAVSDVIQEHRMYLSLAAVVAVVVVAGYLVLERLGHTVATRGGPLLAFALVAAAIAATHVRNGDYRSEFAMIEPADLHEAYTILADHYLLGGGDLALARGEAVDELATAASGSPDFIYAHYMLGLADQKAGDSPGAIEHLRLAVQSDPGFGHAAAKLADELVSTGRLDEARTMLEHSAERAPRSSEVALALGRVLLALGDAAGARARFEHALDLDPNLAAGHNNLGYAIELLGDRAASETEYRAALALDPDMVVARNNLARALFADGDLVAARQNYEQVLAANPEDTFAHDGLADVCERQRDLECAQAHLREAARLTPDDAQIASRLGAILEKSGHTDEALAQYQRALALEPGHVGAGNALGTLLARQGRFAEAAPYFERVLQADPANVDAHSNLGALYATQGKTEEARAHLEAVLRLQPDRPVASFNLGLLHESRGELAEAVKYYERELAVNPGFEAARTNLDRVRAQITSRGG
jgi:protein O-mannosyl-transferase